MKKLPIFMLPVFALLLMLASNSAFAKSGYLNKFKETYLEHYPDASKIAKCTLCHGKGMVKNQFALDFAAAAYDFTAIEELDSDGDGISNIDEIADGKYPGDPAETF